MEITRLKARISGLAWRITLLLAPALLAANFAAAQDLVSVNPEPLPPLANPNDPATPAKELFGRKTTPASLATHTIGFYSKGCIAGAKALPLDGETWQVMESRVSWSLKDWITAACAGVHTLGSTSLPSSATTTARQHFFALFAG
jgi:hypothetical protein